MSTSRLPSSRETLADAPASSEEVAENSVVLGGLADFESRLRCSPAAAAAVASYDLNHDPVRTPGPAAAAAAGDGEKLNGGCGCGFVCLGELAKLNAGGVVVKKDGGCCVSNWKEKEVLFVVGCDCGCGCGCSGCEGGGVLPAGMDRRAVRMGLLLSPLSVLPEPL